MTIEIGGGNSNIEQIGAGSGGIVQMMDNTENFVLAILDGSTDTI